MTYDMYREEGSKRYDIVVRAKVEQCCIKGVRMGYRAASLVL